MDDNVDPLSGAGGIKLGNSEITPTTPHDSNKFHIEVVNNSSIGVKRRYEMIPYTKEEIAARKAEKAATQARVAEAVAEEEERMKKHAEFRNKRERERRNYEASFENTRQIWKERSNAAAARKNPLYAAYPGGRRRSRKTRRRTRRTRK